MAGGKFDQVPAIAVKVLEHGDLAIGLGGWRADEVDAGRGEGGEVAVEIVGGEEQEDAACGLIADRAGLLGRDGAGKEDRGGVCGCAGRAEGDPALVLLGLVGILHESEAELAGVKGERFVIVADDQGDVGEGLGHLHLHEKLHRRQRARKCLFGLIILDNFRDGREPQRHQRDNPLANL